MDPVHVLHNQHQRSKLAAYGATHDALVLAEENETRYPRSNSGVTIIMSPEQQAEQMLLKSVRRRSSARAVRSTLEHDSELRKQHPSLYLLCCAQVGESGVGWWQRGLTWLRGFRSRPAMAVLVPAPAPVAPSLEAAMWHSMNLDDPVLARQALDLLSACGMQFAHRDSVEGRCRATLARKAGDPAP